MCNFEGKPFSPATKQQLNSDKCKYCTYPVVVCWMPGVLKKICQTLQAFNTLQLHKYTISFIAI